MIEQLKDFEDKFFILMQFYKEMLNDVNEPDWSEYNQALVDAFWSFQELRKEIVKKEIDTNV